MKRTEIERLLPYVIRRTMREENPLVAIVEVMAALHQPTEALLERVHTVFNPFTTRDEFVPFLAGWLDLERLFDEMAAEAGTVTATHPPITTGMNCLRALTATAAYLSRWRGTKKGLLHFLEIATGTQGFTIEEQVTADNQSRPFHLYVEAPAALAPHRALVKRIIESEKPAYVTYELKIRDNQSPSKEDVHA